MSVAPVAHDVPVTSVSVPWYQHVLGIAFVAASIVLSCVALDGFSTYTANDYVWPQFAATAPVLRQILNTDLSVLPAATSVTVDVFAPSATILGPLALGVDAVYVRRLVYSDLTDLPSAIVSLRTLNAMQAAELVSPYCWVDFEKVWELAYTAKRQARCALSESSNAAVHLASVLRNVDFDAWRLFTQGRFDAHVGGPIAATGSHGAAWLNALHSHTQWSIRDEAQLWTSVGLTHFTLQYGTGTAFGLHESVWVENALGIRIPWPLKTTPSVNRAQFRNTAVFHAFFVTDLYALSTNQSMVRGTTNYFADTTPDSTECFTVSCPLAGARRALHDQVGAITVLDAKWMPPPPTFVAAAAAFRSRMIAEIAASPALRSLLVAPAVLSLRPVQWADPSLRFLSGNPWCIYGSPLPFVQQTLSFDDVCSRQKPLTSASSLFASVFALTQLSHLTGAAACVAATDVVHCLSVYGAAQAMSRNLSLSHVPLDGAGLASLDIGLFQYVIHETQLQTNASAVPEVKTQPLLDPTFAFFGWMMLYEWAIGEREVISLQGDIQTVNVISVAYPAATSYVPSAPAALGPFLWYSAAATSGILCAVGVTAILLGYRARSNLWGMFNSIVSSVWMARHLLAARGTLACICLATAPTSVRAISESHQLDPRPRPLWVSLVLSSEALWLLCLWYEVTQPVLRRPTAKLRCAALAWVTLVGLDQGWPVTWRVYLERSCDLNDLTVVTCSSGSVAVGSWHRLLIVGLVVLGVAVGAALLSRPEHNTDIHRLLPLSLSSYTQAGTVELDMASALLCGIVPISIRGVAYVVDVKLWRVLACDAYNMSLRRRRIAFLGDSLPSICIRATPAARQRTMTHHVPLLLAAISYLIMTLSSNVAYLSVMSESLANDFGWSGFNTSGTHAFLATTFTALAMSSIDIPDLILDTPTLGMPMYSASHDTIQWQPNLARRQLFDNAAIALTTVVDGLRSMDPCQLPWMFTQYCWLDFDRKWAMASTEARQARCVASMTSNGAVYLEAPLRNINDWSAWERCWGHSFEIGIGAALLATESGRQWLSTLTAGVSNSADAEIAYWRASGLSTFRLQWQNFKTTGFYDTIEVTTAWGQSYPLTIAAFPSELHTDRQTSMRMYWSLASDLWAVATNESGIGGASLLRASANYAFTNTTPEQLLFINTTLVLPLQAGLGELREALGPFGVVDMVYVSVPPPLQQLYAMVVSAVATLTTTNSVAQAQYAKLPEKAFICVAPWELLSASAPPSNVGGNLICGGDLAPVDIAFGLTAFVGFDTQCSWWRSDYLMPSSLQLVFGLLAFNATSVLDTTLDFDAFCASDAFPEPNCADIYADVYRFVEGNASAWLSLAPLASAVHSIVNDLGIVVVQYLRNATSHVELYQRSLFNSSDDRAWPFYGWCLLFDWAVGEREVVSFEGDLGVVRPITAPTSPVVIALDPTEIPTTLSFVFRTGAQYVTVVLISVTVLIVCYTIASLGAIDAFNLFELNRIVGHVWVGRSLLVVRSATALWLLNTSTLTLERNGTSAQLEVPSTPWYKVVLVASELTWLVYVVNDLLSCVTQQYTPSYVWKSSLLTWAFAVGCQAPRRYAASLHRRCVYEDMDARLVCTTGYIKIGHLGGVRTGVLIALAAVVGTAILERWRLPKLPPMPLHTLVLSSASYFALSPDAEMVGTDIDPAFALMAGLISLRWRGVRYAFDIKSWREVSCHDENQDVQEFRAAGPTSSRQDLHVYDKSVH